MKAIFEGTVIAESDATVVVEGNHYFPADSVHAEYLHKTEETYTCSWKGTCDFYDVVVEGKTAERGAWAYTEPKKEAQNIKGYYAFWKDVSIED